MSNLAKVEEFRFFLFREFKWLIILEVVPKRGLLPSRLEGNDFSK